MTTKTLWHIESQYRITTDAPDEDDSPFNLFLAASDDITKVAALIMRAVEDHVAEAHGEDLLSHFVVENIQRVAEVLVDDEDDA